MLLRLSTVHVPAGMRLTTKIPQTRHPGVLHSIIRTNGMDDFFLLSFQPCHMSAIDKNSVGANLWPSANQQNLQPQAIMVFQLLGMYFALESDG